MTVTLVQNNKTTKLQCGNGDNLLAVINGGLLRINAYCGGKGTCKKCRVQVLTADLPYEKSLTKEENEKGFRLACEIKVTKDLTVKISGESEIEVFSCFETKNVKVKPCAKVKKVKLSKPAVTDQTDDLKRLERKLNLTANKNVLNNLSKVLRRNNFECQALIYNKQIAAVYDCKAAYGVAIDIGTTTLAFYLVDLSSGGILKVLSGNNPQRAFGFDVISRIDYCINNKDGLKTLSKLIRDVINDAVFKFKEEFPHVNIMHVTVAGNTTMLHLLAGINPENIAAAPFIPAFTKSIDYFSGELGLNGYFIITLLPSLASYVGADITAGLAACGVDKEEELCLFIDLGTNGEMALGNKNGIVCCSTAAGPAFEGGNISCGMAGAAGAVNKFYLDNNTLKYTVLGGVKPKGICGSGIIDLCALLLKQGVIDETGCFADDIERYDICEGVYFTAKDIRELQLAKAAVRAGILTLIGHLKVSFNDVKKVYLAGGFGSFIDIENAVNVGIIPKELSGKIISAGNTSAHGAYLALINKDYYKRTEVLGAKMRYLELSSNAEFTNYFMDSMMF